MRLTIIQSDIIWEDPEANLLSFTAMLSAYKGKTDLIVLPEMFTTGFTMNSTEFAENMNGPTIRWMKEESRHGEFAIAGSIIIKEGNSFFNRLLFVYPDGRLVSYDKGHLFRMEKENNFFSRGTRHAIVTHKGIRINLMICYDLRFPVWSRVVNNNYDLLVYVASWPASRRQVWLTLLKARAIENQCYVAGVNRIGLDGTGINYTGDSMIIDPKGNIVARADENSVSAADYFIDKTKIDAFRKKFPVWKDADQFELLL